MAINFPNSPSTNDTFVAAGSRWLWNGTAWVRQGTPGSQGVQGATGAQGVQGSTGATGPTGPQGNQGVQGATGADGSTGPQGNQGVQGATGPTGPQGNQGVQGAAGGFSANSDATINNLFVSGISTFAGLTTVTSPTLFANDLNIAGVSTFYGSIHIDNDGINATGSLLRIGENLSYRLSRYNGINYIVAQSGHLRMNLGNGFAIRNYASSKISLDLHPDVGVDLYYNNTKRFETTDDGIKVTGGIQDADGHVGAAGSVLSSTGSALDWISPQSGPQGAQGVQGAGGSTGGTGPQGVQGATGSTGPQGNQGVQGATGSTGPQGVQGAQGRQGATGSTGGTGPTGPTGSTGGTGPQGAQGRQGSTGSTGPQGVQGASGATVGGSANQVVYKNSSNVTAGDSDLTFDGTNLTLGGSMILDTVPFYRNTKTVASNYTVSATYNEMSVGDLTINNGVTVTVSSGARWVIV